MYISSVASFIPILPFFTLSLLEKTPTACRAFRKVSFTFWKIYSIQFGIRKKCSWQSEGKRANKKCDRRSVPEVLDARSTQYHATLFNAKRYQCLRNTLRSYTNVYAVLYEVIRMSTQYSTKLYMCWMLGLIAVIAGLDWGLRRLSGFPPTDEGLLNKILRDQISVMLKMVN